MTKYWTRLIIVKFLLMNQYMPSLALADIGLENGPIILDLFSLVCSKFNVLPCVFNQQMVKGSIILWTFVVQISCAL